jgi:RNA ligase (TIGR02306 family)
MRKLATIQLVSEIKPIEGADMICAYRINGWWVVDKKGQYHVGTPVIYCEVDSWIPHTLAPFLSKGKEPRVFEGIPGERLRTVRLKGQVSQGILFSVSLAGSQWALGDDVSELLGIQKWERPMNAQLAGQMRGNFPPEIPKTDQERIQNIRYDDYLGIEYEITEKLHGSSCTFYLDKENEFHVCSRNWDIKPDANNAYWKIAYKHNLEEKMKENGLQGYAIQGELCGEGINGNNYKLGLEFFVFDVFVVDTGYVRPISRRHFINALGLNHVPLIHTCHLLKESVEELLKWADGKSVLADCKREGFVYKALNSSQTFKVVSNDWLLKYE